MKNKDGIEVIQARKIYEMLALIRGRPELFLTSKSITALQDFISGYMIFGACNDCIYHSNEPDFQDFKYWILKKDGENVRNRFPFVQFLLMETNGEEEVAFERFFEYLEEFKEEKRTENGK